MKKPLTARHLPQPKLPNPEVLYEEEAPITPVVVQYALSPERQQIPFATYLSPVNMHLLYRYAYQRRLSVQEVVNTLVESLTNDDDAHAPMSEKAEAKLQEKLTKPKK